MDLETLFWIAIVFVYFFFQMVGRKRNQKGAKPQPQRRPEPANEELNEALREIRRALGWPEEAAPEVEETRTPEPAVTRIPEPERTRLPEPERTRLPEPEMRRLPEPVRPRIPEPIRTPIPERRVPAPARHTPLRAGHPKKPEESAFRFEEAFEKTGEPSARSHRRSEVALEKVKKPVSPIASRLNNPKTLRQEFLLKEILDRPIALRRRR